MDLIATGLIRKPFGVYGFVRVESFSGEFEHFLGFDEVFLKFPPRKVEGENIKEGRFKVAEVNLRVADALIKFKGIDSPEAAKSLAGSELFVPRDKASPLQKGEVYVKDLCNCVLVHKDSIIGKITSVVEGGGGYLLEISEAATGKLAYIPYNKKFVGKVDLEQNTVELMHLWILE